MTMAMELMIMMIVKNNRENYDDCFEPNRQNDNDEQDMGLPADLARVDGAMRWGHNDKTYFFSGG